MTLKRNDYKKRLVDEKMIKYLNIFDCVLIEGPKWCGKTWTSENVANSEILLSDIRIREQINLRPEIIFNSKEYVSPLLIDEWQNIPEIWDMMRNYIDRNKNKSKYILTGSSSFKRIKENTKIFHSGTGRIVSLKMTCMTLFESGDSDGKVSIFDMYNKKDFYFNTKKYH